MDNNLLDFLDWQDIVSEISKNAYLDLTKTKLCEKPSQITQEKIENNYDALTYFLPRLDEDKVVLSNAFSRIPSKETPYIQMSGLQKGISFDIKGLNFLANLFSSYHLLHKNFKKSPFYPQFNLPEETLFKIKREFYDPFRNFVTEEGEILYQNHTLLWPVYQGVLNLEQTLRENIKNISRKNPFKDRLQYGEYDILGDHFVLPIRADSYMNALGPIISKSQTGLTLFVAPAELIEKNNRRLELQLELEELINKICRTFSELLSPLHDFFQEIKRFLIYIDETHSKAIYCYSANLNRPDFNNDGVIKLDNFFHPLISNPIKNDFLLMRESGLVLSGPNTGGKTVTLKTLCLIHLFPYYGLFIPASYANISLFEGIYYFSHDQQDLKKGLSSFSSEVENYLRLLEEMDTLSSSIIFIDEIFNSTSSEEASSLGYGLFEELLSRSHHSCKIIVSTHHQLLKSLVSTNNDFLSGHVGFDLEKEAPTYKIILGTPGPSMAFEIFSKISKKLNMRSSIVNKAITYLQGKQVNFEKIISDVDKKRQDLQEEINRYNRINLEISNEKASLKGAIEFEKEKLKRDFKDKIFKLEQKIYRGLSDLKTKKESEKILVESLHETRELTQNKIGSDFEGDSPEITEIEIGQHYFSKILQTEVTVLSVNIPRNKIQVGNKNIKNWCSSTELIKIKRSKKKQSSPPANFFNQNSNARIEYDCRGMKLDEFMNLIDQILYDLRSEEIPFVTIIHGHGEGVLKRWLRDFIKREGDLSMEIPDGNDGTTKINII